MSEEIRPSIKELGVVEDQLQRSKEVDLVGEVTIEPIENEQGCRLTASRGDGYKLIMSTEYSSFGVRDKNGVGVVLVSLSGKYVDELSLGMDDFPEIDSFDVGFFEEIGRRYARKFLGLEGVSQEESIPGDWLLKNVFPDIKEGRDKAGLDVGDIMKA